MNLEQITEQHIVDFQRDGAVCIRGLFEPDEIDRLRQGIDYNLSHPSPRAKIASHPDDPGRFFEDFCNWQDIPAYSAFVNTSGLGHLTAQLMRSHSSRFYHDHVLVKEAGTRQTTPWHQDQPYYNISGRQNCSLWLPVDPVPAESTLEFIKGSHNGPWLMPRTFMDNQAKWFPEGSLQELPDIESDRDAFEILGWAMEPGDAVFFHMLTLHASKGSSTQRRVFSARFVGDDVRFAKRDWRTSPPFEEIAGQIVDGQALTQSCFPRLI